MTDLIVVRSKIKEYAKDGKQKYYVSGDFAEALSFKVESMIKDAIRRAKANGRRTVQSKDL